jgi:hypothetical protein
VASGSTAQGSGSTAGARGSTAPRSGSTAVPSPGACACGSRRGCNFLHPPSSGSTVNLSGTTAPDFCTAPPSAEVGTEVIFYFRASPVPVDTDLAIVPYWRAVVPLRRFYRSLPSAIGLHLATTVRAVVPHPTAVVPQPLAVVPWLLCGSTAMRGLRVGITVGFFPPLYKGGLLPQEDHLFPPQAPLLLKAPFSPDLSP